MKIYDLNLTGGTAAAESGRAQEAQRLDRASGNRAGGAASGAGDRVEFSGALGRLAQAMSSFGADRASRVEALAAQYQSGNYRPDAAAVARGMVAESLSTGGH
jgi:flagellar biosynthesis anti-sigma factor FlgM